MKSVSVRHYISKERLILHFKKVYFEWYKISACKTFSVIRSVMNLQVVFGSLKMNLHCLL